MLLLADLPCDVKAQLLRDLAPHSLLACLATAKVFWHDESQGLWRELAASRRLHIPENTGRLLRSKIDARRTFLQALRRQEEMRTLLIHDLWSAIWGGDNATKLRTCFDADPHLDPSARLQQHAGATLLNLAARRNRPRCVRFLVERGANIDALDGGDFSPLAGAAWTGNLGIVKYLVGQGARLDSRGVPPMTSACGGKGPFTAEEWAQRKADHYKDQDPMDARDFAQIARLLARARVK